MPLPRFLYCLLSTWPVVSFKTNSEGLHAVGLGTRARPQPDDASSRINALHGDDENVNYDSGLPKDRNYCSDEFSLESSQSLPPWCEANYRFSSYANWIDRGLLVGRYPGVEPSRCSNASRAKAHLTELIAEANVVTWVCFQAEIPSQESALPAEHRSTRESSTMQVATLVDVEANATSVAGETSTESALDPLIDSPAPWTKPSAEEWKPGEPNAFLEGGRSGDFGAYAPTVTRIAAALGKPAPRFLHFPIMDLTAPTLPHLRAIVRVLWKEVERYRQDPGSGAVYLHCWGGKGRSGTVGAALLAMLYSDASEAEILARLRSAFLTRGLPGETPETESQLEVLSQFIKELRDEDTGLRDT